jgi:hypothetical protein
MEMIMAEWYYVDSGERVGPITQDEVEKLVVDGVLDADSYVWTKGYENWEKLGEVEELSYIYATEEAADTGLPPVIGDEGPKEFSWEDLGNHDKVIMIKVGIDRGGKETEYGPYTLIELQKAFGENRINEKTLVFINGMNEWIFLSDSPIFEKFFGSPQIKIEDIDRRKNSRKPFVARMFFHDTNELFEGVCRDISTGGMQVLVSGAPFNVGDEITLNVHPDNDSYSFVASGSVVRKLDADQGFALRFKNLSGEAEAAIDSYVKSN